jgi:hypothetical protein
VQGFVKLFLVVGIAALCGGVAWGFHTRAFLARAQSAPGAVVSLETYEDGDHTTMYKPVVQFTTSAGRETTFTGNGSHPPAYDPGEAVTVLYDPADPDDARIKDFWSLWGGPTCLSLLGIIFAVIALGLRAATRSGAQHKEYLRVNGTPIETEVTGIERNERLEVNGVNPWRITSRGVDPATGEQRDFHSENLWFDPTGHLKVKQVTVLLDPQKPKRYYMDISFLPQPCDE